jgi:hypothetical protein
MASWANAGAAIITESNPAAAIVLIEFIAVLHIVDARLCRTRKRAHARHGCVFLRMPIARVGLHPNGGCLTGI